MAFNVISVINLDMAYPNASRVNAVQYDSSGRVVKARLLNNGVSWAVPSNAHPIIRYKKSDRNGGFYDTDENNAYAISYEESRTVINITLALQVLTSPGNADMQINFYNNSGERVTTFKFKVFVEASTVEDGEIVSTKYYNALTKTIQKACEEVDLAEAVPRAEAAVHDAEVAAANAQEAVQSLSESVIPTAAAKWLRENITNPTSPPLDTSLSVGGAAADAGAVGKLIPLLLKGFGKNITTATSGLLDANDADINTIYVISHSGIVANMPEDLPGLLIRFSTTNAKSSGDAELFLSTTGILFTRILWGGSGGTWSDWRKTPDISDVMAQNVTRVSNTSVLASFEEAELNKIYTITANEIPGYPTILGNSNGTLITFNGSVSAGTAGSVQLFFHKTGVMATRIRWGSSGGKWSPWQIGSTLSNESYYAGLTMFDSFGVVGDSFSSGTIYIDGTGTELKNLSWGKNLEKLNGVTCKNYAKGGSTTRDYVDTSTSWYATTGLGKLLSDVTSGNPCGLYLLCLGINDTNITKTGGLSYLGSSSDIKADYRNNGDTFWGNYGKIIAMIKEASPKSKIVMSTYARIPTANTAEAYEAFNTAIQEIAAYFSIPCIVLTEDPFFNSSYYLDNMVSSHPTAPIYVGYAKGIDRLLSKCMVIYDSYFKTYYGMS